MASPGWQNNFNNQQRQSMQNMFNAITSGNVDQIDNMLRTYTNQPGSKRVQDDMSVGRDAYSNVLRQIASDYINLGGVSPETHALIQQQQTQGGYRHSVGERESGERAGFGMFRQLAKALPQVTSTSGEAQVKMLGIPPGMSPAEYMQLFVTNQMSQQLDPVSRQETQQQLARTNPMLFRAYGMQPMRNAAPVDQAPTADRLNQLAGSLDFNAVRAQLPASVQGAVGANVQGVGSGLDWMRRYLQTSAQGAGGTRQQQQLAAGQLRNLEQEAESNRALGGYRNLAQNLTNPVLNRSSLSNIIGQGRALGSPSGGFRRRGVTARNPFAT